MDVPKQILSDLTTQNMGSYEWRIVMVILIMTYGAGRKSRTISLDDFVGMTGIKKPHVSRAIANLSYRNVVNRLSYGNTATYSLQEDADKWRSLMSRGNDRQKPIPEKIKVDFEIWFARYPIEIRRADSEALYCELIVSGEATPKDLDDALRGYSQFEKFRAMKFGKEVDPWKCIYPTTFLAKGRWKEYLEYADVKKKPPL